jgi:hypothetical protein
VAAVFVIVEETSPAYYSGTMLYLPSRLSRQRRACTVYAYEHSSSEKKNPAQKKSGAAFQKEDGARLFTLH